MEIIKKIYFSQGNYKIMLKSLKWILSRAIVFYLIVYSFSNVIVDYEKIRFGLKIKILNSVMPQSFSYLIESVEAQKEKDALIIEQYVKFYVKVVEFFPERADALGMLGFCYYHLGQVKKAISAYTQATSLEPDLFWFPYNLGLIYAQNGQYQKAKDYFHKALNADLKKTLGYITASKVIYRGLLLHVRQGEQELNRRLNEGYRNALNFFIFCAYQTGDFNDLTQYFNQAVTLKVKDLDKIYRYAGIVTYRMGKYNDALFYFKESLRNNPQNGEEIYYYLGLTYQALGDDTLANEWKNKARTHHPQELNKTPVLSSQLQIF